MEDIVIGLPKQIVRNTHVDLLEAPGLGARYRSEGAKKGLAEKMQASSTSSLPAHRENR